MKKILIVNQHYEIGGIRKTLDVFIKTMSNYYSIDVQFLKTPNQFVCPNDNVKMLKPLKYINYFLMSKNELKNEKRIIPFLCKTIFSLISKIIGRRRTIKLCLWLNKKTYNYHCVISYSNDINGSGFFGGCNYYVDKKTISKNKIAWIHANPELIGLTAEIAKKTYANFNYIINVSNTCKRKFDELCPIYSNKNIFIRNLYDVDDIMLKSFIDDGFVFSEDFNIITVSRISSLAKRIDKINIICEMLVKKNYKFHWYIVGDGADLGKYILDSKQKHIDKYVTYLGAKVNPYYYIKNCSLFVLPSDSEAFSTVIYESLILGKPAIMGSFGSAYEMIEDGVNGYIVDGSCESFAQRIEFILNNNAKYQELLSNIKGKKISNESSIDDLRKIIG